MQRPRTILLVVTFLAAMLAVDSDAFGQRGRSSGGGRSSVGRSSGRSSSSIGRSSGRSSASIGRSSSRSSGSRSISRPSSSSRSSSSRSSVSRPSSSSSSRGYSSRGYSPSRSSSGSNVRYITTPARSSSRSSSRPSSSSTYRSGEASIPNRTTTARSSSDYGGWRARPPAQPTTSTPIDRPNFVDLSGAGAQPRYRLPSFSGSVSRARTRTQPGTGPSASARARSRSRLSEPVDTSQTFRPRTVTRADILARYSGTPEARAVDARSALRLPMLSKTRRSPAAELPAGVIADRTQPRSGLPAPDAGRGVGVVTPARVDRANAGRRAGTRVASTPTPTDWARSSRSDSAKRMRDLPRTNPERARNIRAAGAAITRAQDAGLRAGSRLLTGVGLSPSDLTRRSERGTDLATDRGRDAGGDAGGDYGGDVGGDGDYGGDGDGDWDHDHDHDHDHHNPNNWYWWWGYPYGGYGYGYGYGLGWGLYWGLYWGSGGYWYQPYHNYGYYNPYPVYYSTVVYRTVYEDGYVDDGGYDDGGTVLEEPLVGEGAVPAAPVGEQPLTPAQSMNRASDYYLVLGDRAFREGRYGDAVHFYAKAVEFAPNEGVLYLILSDALFATGDYHYAAYTLRKAFELDPGIVDNIVDKHSFYADPVEFDRQIAVLERYLEDHFLDDDARLVLAANYLFGGRPAAAVDLLESAFSQEVVKSPAGQVVLAGAEKIQYGEPVGK